MTKCDCNCEGCKFCIEKAKGYDKQKKRVNEFLLNVYPDEFNLLNKKDFKILTECWIKKYPNEKINFTSEKDYISWRYRIIRNYIKEYFLLTWKCFKWNKKYWNKHNFFDSKLEFNDWLKQNNHIEFANYDRDILKKHFKHVACFWCQECLPYKDITLDHLKAESRGGKFILRNLVPAHKWCNNFKKDICFHLKLNYSIDKIPPWDKNSRSYIYDKKLHPEYPTDINIEKTNPLNILEIRCHDCHALLKIISHQIESKSNV